MGHNCTYRLYVRVSYFALYHFLSKHSRPKMRLSHRTATSITHLLPQSIVADDLDHPPTTAVVREPAQPTTSVSPLCLVLVLLLSRQECRPLPRLTRTKKNKLLLDEDCNNDKQSSNREKGVTSRARCACSTWPVLPGLICTGQQMTWAQQMILLFV